MLPAATRLLDGGPNIPRFALRVGQQNVRVAVSSSPRHIRGNGKHFDPPVDGAP